MSDEASHNLKVSREGIVLIKSFEGFRPRAIQRAEGGWIIGYGHTLSAREGATVSEADAELLLRYDLMAVEKAVNGAVPTELNQHQFDALVSFAFSVGVDRFAGSDVRQRLNAGAPGEAADAIMGWPEPTLPETALRRRAAERALFVANPGAPVALSDLLSAPLPPPPVPTPVEALEAESVEAEPILDAEPASTIEAQAGADAVAPVDPRGAAVAALLGEQPARLVQDEAIIPSFGSPTPVAPPAPSNDNPPAKAGTEGAEPETEAARAEAAAEPEDETPVSEPVEAAATVSDDAKPQPVGKDAADASVSEDSVDAEAQQEEGPTKGAVAWSAARYSPYSLSMIGPLPYLQPAAPKAAAIDHAVIQVAAVEVEAAPAAEPEIEAEVIEPAVETALVKSHSSPAEAAEADAEPEAENAIETVETEVVEPAVETAAAAIDETLAIEPVAVAEPESTARVEPMAYVTPVPVGPVAELVLTPLEDAPEPLIVRPMWTPEERDAPDGSENNLFGEDLTLTLGGSVMRHEMEYEAPARFDWKETAPFIFMGGVGLVSFGASMAAFRRAAEQSGGSELTLIGWVLALIGLGCVGVSSINLYRKFGLPGGD